MHPNRQKSVGFTLIEMMVTIAIAALFSACWSCPIW